MDKENEIAAFLKGYETGGYNALKHLPEILRKECATLEEAIQWIKAATAAMEELRFKV